MNSPLFISAKARHARSPCCGKILWRIPEFFIAFTWSFYSFGQLIEINPEQIFIRPWLFSSSYIKKNKIYKIHLSILDKKDFEKARDMNRQISYEFDTLGREIFSYTVDPVGVITQTYVVHRGKRKKYSMVAERTIPLSDTVFQQLSYDEKGNLRMQRQWKKSSHANASYFTYFENGFVREIRCREWPRFWTGKNFILEKQEVIYTDSFRWESPSEKYRKKIFYNSDQKVYKEWHYEYENGQLVMIREIFPAAPWVEQYQKFFYENRKIVRAVMVSDVGNRWELSYEYIYEKNHLPYAVYQRKNNFLETETGFVNDTISGYPHSIVIRKYHEKSIQIIRLQVFSGKPPMVEQSSK